MRNRPVALRQEPPTLASGVITRVVQGLPEILIAKLPGEPHAGRWTFPGGPVERGEMPEPALRRALVTLLGLKVRVIYGQPPFDQTWDNVVCRWRFYFCEPQSHKVHNEHYAQIRWIPRASLREYEFDPVSQKVVDWMLEEER